MNRVPDHHPTKPETQRSPKRRRAPALVGAALIGLVVMLGGVGAASAATPRASAEPQQCPAGPSDSGAVEWSVAPADAAGPDGRISLRHSVAPGAKAADAIAVTNLSATAATFSVEVGAGAVGQDGLFDIVAGQGEGAAGWIAVDGLQDGNVLVRSCETRVLPVSVTVPADAAPGDHPAGIAVGVSSGGEVALTHRVGVRLHLRVPGLITPALVTTVTQARFTPSGVPFADGRLHLDYRIENTGNVRLGAQLAADAAGLFGWARHPGPEIPPIREILPGEAVEGSLALEMPALFRLSGGLTVTPIKVGEDETVAPEPYANRFTVAALSWPNIVVVLALVTGMVAVMVWRHRLSLTGRRAPAKAETERV
ncbi:MAG: hypothetical protein LBH68_07190 [Bifidobacteriaceae bacterium]|nr:hypothetical protein [Bifidobacteriaceae bacterium]